MLRFLSRPATKMMERYLPDAFVFVIVLTLIAMAAAMLTQPVTPMQVITAWGNGFWELLSFAMQMLLVLVTGYIMATTPPVRAALERLAGLARSPAMAIIMVSLVSLAASWINWGFGLVGSRPIWLSAKWPGVEIVSGTDPEIPPCQITNPA